MKYEYKVLTFDAKGLFSRKMDPSGIESQLNQYGSEGWELIKVTEVLKELGVTSSLVAFMKRSLQ